MIPIDLSTDLLVAELNQRQTEIISCYSSTIETMLAESKAGRLSIPLKVLIGNGGRVEPEMAAEAKAHWSLMLPVLNPWASVETIGAMACLSGGSHLSEDINVFELVDSEGQPVIRGEASDKVFISVLYNRLLPLIRYEIADSFREVAEPCACCGPFFRRVDVLGRTESFVHEDIKVHPAVFMVPILEDRRITRFQVRQTLTGADVDIVADGVSLDDCARLSEALRRDLSSLGIPDPVMRVNVVDAVKVSPSGKTVSFIPLPQDG